MYIYIGIYRHTCYCLTISDGIFMRSKLKSSQIYCIDCIKIMYVRISFVTSLNILSLLGPTPIIRLDPKSYYTLKTGLSLFNLFISPNKICSCCCLLVVCVATALSSRVCFAFGNVTIWQDEKASAVIAP